MKRLIYLIIISITVIITTSGVKVKYSETIDPYHFEIENMKVGNGCTTFKLKVWQDGVRSVKILLEENPTLFLDGNEPGISGNVSKWGKEQFISSKPKVVGEKPVKFEVVFPDTTILFSSKFDLKLGYVIGKDTTALIFRDVPIKRNKDRYRDTMF